MVEYTAFGTFPTCSMMSISPQPGQPATGKLAPSSQKAGHNPCVPETLMRASTCPYVKVKPLAVLIRPDVYWHGPPGQLDPAVTSRRASMTSEPDPFIRALLLLV